MDSSNNWQVLHQNKELMEEKESLSQENGQLKERMDELEKTIQGMEEQRKFIIIRYKRLKSEFVSLKEEKGEDAKLKGAFEDVKRKKPLDKAKGNISLKEDERTKEQLKKVV